MAKLDAPAMAAAIVAPRPTRSSRASARWPSPCARRPRSPSPPRPSRRPAAGPTSPSARRATPSPDGTAGRGRRRRPARATATGHVRALLAGERVDGFRLRQPPPATTLTVAAFGPRAVEIAARRRPHGAQHGHRRRPPAGSPRSHPNTAVWLAAAVDPTPGRAAVDGPRLRRLPRRARVTPRCSTTPASATSWRSPAPGRTPASWPPGSPTDCWTPSRSSATSHGPQPHRRLRRRRRHRDRSRRPPARPPERPPHPRRPRPAGPIRVSEVARKRGVPHSERDATLGWATARRVSASWPRSRRPSVSCSLGATSGAGSRRGRRAGTAGARWTSRRSTRRRACTADDGDLAPPRRRGRSPGGSRPGGRCRPDHRRPRVPRPATSSNRNARAARSAASARASSIWANALSARVLEENSGRLPSAIATSSSIARRPMPRATAATPAASRAKFGKAAERHVDRRATDTGLDRAPRRDPDAVDGEVERAGSRAGRTCTRCRGT